jgi:IclR family transcriptional regulator, pca regulon regulatory protein
MRRSAKISRISASDFRSVAVPIRRYDGSIIAALNIGAHVDRISLARMRERFLPLAEVQSVPRAGARP